MLARSATCPIPIAPPATSTHASLAKLDITPLPLAANFAPASLAATLAPPPPLARSASLGSISQEAAVRIVQVNARTALMLQLVRAAPWATI